MTYNLIFIYFTPGIYTFLGNLGPRTAFAQCLHRKKEMVDLAKDWRIVLKFKLVIFEIKGQKFFSMISKIDSTRFILV